MKRNKFRALFVWVTLAMALCGSIVGCSSNRKSPNEVSNSGAIAEEDFADAAIAEDSSQAPVVFMPFELRIEGAESGDNTKIKVIVTYHTEIEANPVLSLKVAPPNGIVGSPQVELEPGANGDEVAREFIVTGHHPEIEATVRYQTDGFGAEMHESYPVSNLKKRARERVADPRKPLPAPIYIDGQVITHGVEVTPQ